jgi:FeS assembly protein IscX
VLENSRTEPLTGEDTFEIALALQRCHPEVNLEAVSLGMIYQWTIALPAFADDPELMNDAILMDIYREWFEEANTI